MAKIIPRQLDNPAAGIIGEQVGGPPAASEADHSQMCSICGQAFDMRDFGQLVHHSAASHEPIPENA